MELLFDYKNGKKPIRSLQGVGERVVLKLATLGLHSIEDLLYFYPRKYEDFTNPRSISEVVLGIRQIIKARVISINNGISARKRMKLTNARVADESGQLDLIWFNQPFLVRLLVPGTTWLFAGMAERDYKGKTTMVSPVIEREGRLVPIYNETAGLTSKMLRNLTAQIRPLIKGLKDWLPEETRRDNKLTGISDAFELIHFPNSIEQISAAKKRLAFDELFFLLLQIELSKRELEQTKSPICKVDDDAVQKFKDSLPFTLTNSQELAINEILADIALRKSMNRLLEGDVGSGKTIVAAAAALAAANNGYQTVWMAPTEILATQHYYSFERYLKPHGLKCCLLTGSTSKAMRAQINEFNLIVGTQAVIQESVRFKNLGLLIVDEQHRFGVKQRNLLVSQKDGLIPHFLAMTATPIPRTLALTIYGDLDISLLKSVPTGRKLIISKLVDAGSRQKAYDFIKKEIKSGRQAFVVCPLIEESGPIQLGQTRLDFQEKKAALAEYEKLQNQIFSDLRIGLLHGKLKPKEKEETMSLFREGKIDILVCTAVIEVGIDIPNATVMMIESAERFGLAQLHQFRGRVGRAEHQSYCFVFTDSSNDSVFERLHAFTRTNSGFELAELDLQIRGPGQLAGLKQSGFGSLKLASLSDIDLIRQAKAAALKASEIGIDNFPLLKAQLERQAEITHLA